MIELLQGDCLEKLKLIEDNSIDALVTDPPAGIGFMGKEWDKDKGGRDGWILWLTEIMLEAKRTLKPGGHGLVWALPRTSHWTATALENAGFEIRDCVYHVFGSGFPKSLNISKAINKDEGVEFAAAAAGVGFMNGNDDGYNTTLNQLTQTGESTRNAKKWEGWGTALKPAVECWWLVRKPLEASTVAKNVLEYGTGALNIDASRIGTDQSLKGGRYSILPDCADGNAYGSGINNRSKDVFVQQSGRWPSHLIHDGSDEVLEHFPQTHKAGNTKASDMSGGTSTFGIGQIKVNPAISGDSGGSAARFFYSAKPSKAERNHRLEALEGERTMGKDSRDRPTPLNQNHHPTVKGQALMRYLITLITPPEGTVLDMFMGSGSTGVAAKALGFGFVGVELEIEYFEIAKARIDGTRVGEPLEFDKPVEINENQLDLFGLENKETETE